MNEPPQGNSTAHTVKQQAYARLQDGDLEEAKALYARACELDPADAEARYNLGTVAKDLGHHQEAEAAYRETLRLKPDSFVVLHNLGTVLTEQGRPDEAAECFEAALRLNPNALSHTNLGNICTSRQELEKAVDHYRQALALEPGHAEIYNNLGTALLRLGRHADAENAFREALRLNPDFVSAYINLGGALVQLGRLDEAQATCRRAMALDPGCDRAAAGLADALERQGGVDQAYELIQRHLKGDETDVNVALGFASLCRRFDRCGEAVALCERLLTLQRPSIDVYRRILLHFSLGRVLDGNGEFEQAFAHYREGNALVGEHFDSRAHGQFVDALVKTWTSEFISRAPHASIRSQRPVFIIGMPRSGTTLVEQILASHPAVHGAGELDEIQQIANALPNILGVRDQYPACLGALTGTHCDRLAQRYLDHLSSLAPAHAAKVTDKMPGNFHHLGLISLLFPGARIIHCVRDPFDTCLSCYFQHFSESHPYAYDLEDLGTYYRQYRRLMEHWGNVLDIPVLEVRYEALVADQEGISRTMLEFCGLEWNDSCLRFHETQRVVITASQHQVRQPLYKGSVERWRNYERHLEPLRRGLGLLG